MGIVVDLGCYDWGGTVDSMAYLAKRFKPDEVWGFDPALPRSGSRSIDDIPCGLHRMAAWTHNGHVNFLPDTYGSTVQEEGEDNLVVCFDFSEWLRDLGKPIILKMDIEGAEVPILRKMEQEGTTEMVDLLLIEWHGKTVPVSCPQEDWVM